MDALKNNLSELIGYIKYKIDNDLCTPEEIESVSKMVMENLELYGTIEDMAKFYGVQESKVRNTINRKMLEKPKRRVYYRFLSFMKIVPERWRKSQIVDES